MTQPQVVTPFIPLLAQIIERVNRPHANKAALTALPGTANGALPLTSDKHPTPPDVRTAV
jgi:hypothetical protein